MRKQRKNSMTPYIMLGKQDIRIYYLPNSDIISKCYWSQNVHNINEINDKSYISQYFFDANNIGMGTAKDITIKWKYNVKYLIDQITTIDKKKLFTFHMDDETLKIRQINGIEFFEMMEEYNSSYEYILSSQIKNESLK